MKKAVFIMVISILTAKLSFAGLPNEYDRSADENAATENVGIAGAPKHSTIPSCDEAAYTGKAPIGYVCAAIAGTFEKVNRPGFKVAWKHLETGLIWSVESEHYPHIPGISDTLTYFDVAWDRCASLNAHLPLNNEYFLSNFDGNGYLLPFNFPYESFTSELDPYNTNLAIIASRGAPAFPREDGHWGGADRASIGVDTICVDDSQAIIKRVRPSRPTPLEHKEF